MPHHLPQNHGRQTDTVGHGGEEPRTGTADVIAGESDRCDDGGGYDLRGGEAVALAFLSLSGVRPFHFAHLESIGEYQAKVIHKPTGAILGSEVNQMADYRIEPDGLVIQYVSEKSTLRTSPPGRVKIGARLAFKTQHDTRQFVVAGEREGFVFEGKEFLTD